MGLPITAVRMTIAEPNMPVYELPYAKLTASRPEIRQNRAFPAASGILRGQLARAKPKARAGAVSPFSSRFLALLVDASSKLTARGLS
jgi:hypothetical protein